ncbi:MAG: TetR/AcrR family transcriptional regulator [Acidimicrobiales bacterium]
MTDDALTASPRPSPRERSPRVEEIVDAARSLLEAHGREGLTMRRLGDALGIRAASLYKHLSGRSALEVALVEIGLDETGVALHRAVGGPAHGRIGRLLDAYRAIGLANPELYRLITSGSLPRAQLLPDLEAWAGEPFYLAAGEPHLAQALWSFAHGTLILELDQRFSKGSELERTWRAGCEAFTAAREPS